MATKIGWFDIPLGGDPLKYSYSADEMRDIFRSIMTNGIIPEIRQSTTNSILPTKQLGSALSANVGQGLNITINQGIGWIDGAYCIVTQPELIPVQAGWINDIVLRLDKTGSDIVYGIFAKRRGAGTIEAGLTREGGVYELGLHSINVPANCEQVTANMITDHRLNMLKGSDNLPCCGIVGSLLMPDIDEWYKSATQEQRDWFNQSQAEFLRWSTEQQAEFDSWSVEQKLQFNSWFATLQNVLDKNTAGNLYNQIANKILISSTQPTIESQNTNDFWYDKADNQDTFKMKKRNSDGTYPQLYPETKASAVLMNDGKSIESSVVTTLTHTKTGTAHILTGTIPTTGLVNANFLATADGVTEDTMKINGVVYLAQDTLGNPMSGFKAGVAVPIVININSKKVTVGGGGGGSMKGSQLFDIPRSNLYSDINLAQWTKTNIPSASNVVWYNLWKQDNIVYTMWNETLVKRNLDTNELLGSVVYPTISGCTLSSPFIYNNELYCYGARNTTPYKVLIYKINEITSTRTFIAEASSFDVTGYSNGTVQQVIKLTDTKFMFIQFLWNNPSGGTSYYFNPNIYDFATNTFTFLYPTNRGASSYVGMPCAPYQFDGLGNIYIAFLSAAKTLTILKVNIETLSVLSVGNIAIPNTAQYLFTIPIGKKAMLFSSANLNDKYVGEIDLINLTIDMTKYNNPQITPTVNNIVVYKDTARMYYTDSVQTLPLSQSPPQNNARVLKLFKGQEVNVLSDDPIEFVALSTGQPALTVTKTPTTLTSDISIYQGGYQADVVKTLLVVNN